MPNSGRIIGLGNALVDVLAHVDKDAVARHDLTPGGMHLVDSDAAEALYAEVGPGLTQSGGSVANTMAHLAAAGRAVTFIGRVADDELGAAFRKDLESLGASCPVAPATGGLGTGRCVVLVAPDGERTMSTFLGAAQEITASEAAAAVPAEADIALIEGYVFDAPDGAAVIDAVVTMAQSAGAKIALTPSDAGCVERHLEPMRKFIADHCDLLIGNEDEMKALSGATDAEAALDWASARSEVAVVTLSERGSLAAKGDERFTVEAAPVERVVDSTGAGDAYAAGFVSEFVRSGDVKAAATAGGALAAQVITHTGAREHTGEAA